MFEIVRVEKQTGFKVLTRRRAVKPPSASRHEFRMCAVALIDHETRVML